MSKLKTLQKNLNTPVTIYKVDQGNFKSPPILDTLEIEREKLKIYISVGWHLTKKAAFTYATSTIQKRHAQTMKALKDLEAKS